MKKILALPLLLCCFTFFFSSCFHGKTYKGNNIILTKEINISDYHEIKIDGMAVILYEQSSDDPFLSITTDQNMHQLLSVYTQGGVLHIRPAKEYIHLDPSRLVIHSNSRQLNKIDINGSGDVSIEDTLTVKKLDIDINGSGKVVFKKALMADELNIDIQGSGDIYVVGKLQRANYEIYGSGNIKAFKCETSVGNFDIAGSGRMEVFVLDRMNCEIAGNGSIFYKGDPRIVIDGSGKSRIRRAD